MHDGKAHAGAGVVLDAVESHEGSHDVVVLVYWYPDAVVADGDQVAIADRLGEDPDVGARSRFMMGEIYFGKREFDKASIRLEDWNHMNGRDLCALTQKEFSLKVPIDPSTLVWTHIELLKQCKSDVICFPSH